MKTNSRKGKAAFTLIELMAVITIIVILAGLVVGGLGYVSEKQASSKAKVQIALISKALEEYKMDMGLYAAGAANSTDGKTQSRYLYEKLFYEGYEYSNNPNRPDPTNVKATKIYLPELDPRTSKQGWVDPIDPSATPPTTNTIKDPWGTEYRYRPSKNSAGAANTSAVNPDFDLWSTGKDATSNPTTPSDKTNRDDIRNF